MEIAADELLQELDRVELTLDEAARRAGDGCDPEFERRLGARELGQTRGDPLLRRIASEPVFGVALEPHGIHRSA